MNQLDPQYQTDDIPVVDINIVKDQVIRTRNTEDGPMSFAVDVFFIAAQAPDGRRWVLPGSSYKNEQDAKDALCAVETDPISKPEAWQEIDPVYGSDAWTTENDRDLACFEADCYGHHRPNW